MSPAGAIWDTRGAGEPEFDRRWNERLACMSFAPFAMRLDYLRWEAAHGRHARAVLVDEVRGALVLRAERGGWVSGWPWRWQAGVEEDEGTCGIDARQSRVLLEAAREAGGGARVRFSGPGALPAGVAGWHHGSTVHQCLAATEVELFERLDDAKRRNLKRARRDGFIVVVADRVDQFRTFQRLQHETGTWRGDLVAGSDDALPAPGEGWREWELPWMRLLVAERDGVVEAGSGFGIHQGGTLDYRTNASSLAGRKAGANVLLGWEAIRTGRELGFRRLNWGGATRFKRELGGNAVPVWCGLTGGRLWTLPNLLSVSVQRARRRAAASWKRVRRPKEGERR